MILFITAILSAVFGYAMCGLLSNSRENRSIENVIVAIESSGKPVLIDGNLYRIKKEAR